ncbi:hypothetical protein [Pseudomonas sp. S3_F07]
MIGLEENSAAKKKLLKKHSSLSRGKEGKGIYFLDPKLGGASRVLGLSEDHEGVELREAGASIAIVAEDHWQKMLFR